MYGGEHEIKFKQGFNIGVRGDARPITGADDEFGVEVVNKITSLKGESYMGANEFSAFVGMNANKQGERISIPLRMRSQTTKVAIAGTAQRSSVSYVSFSGYEDNLQQSFDKLIYGYGKAFGRKNINHLESAIGVDLFKGVFPKEVLSGEILQTGKQQQEMIQTLHNLLLGEIDTAKKATGASFTLRGNKAKTFNKFLINQQSGDEINLTDLLYSGNAQFHISNNNPEQYKEQLRNLVEIYQDVRYENANGYSLFNKIIDDKQLAPNNYLTDAWAASKDFWSQIKETGMYNGKRFSDLTDKEVRHHIWSAAPQLTAMENMALSQGSKGFNTARFAMRDQFMSIGTSKIGIMKELISRNEVDTKLLMMEQELMRSSVAAPHKMPELVKKYHEYVKNVYGENVADQYIHQQKIHGNSKEAIAEMKADASKFFGDGGVNINMLREEPSLAANTFLASDRNMVGKIFINENGGLVHIPSANAMGGLTVLPNGKATFEGKNAANVPSFYKLMENARANGYITSRAMDVASSSMYRLSDMIVKDRAKIQIHAAVYARNVYDRSLTQHDVMGMIDDRTGKFASISNESRSTIGHLTSISEHDAKLMVQDELLKYIKAKQIGSSNTVNTLLNDMRAGWIHQDHGGLIEELNSKLFSKSGHMIADEEEAFNAVKNMSNRIVNKRIFHAERLKTRINRLHYMAQNQDRYTPEQINKQVNRISNYVEKKFIKAIWDTSSWYLSFIRVSIAWICK